MKIKHKLIINSAILVVSMFLMLILMNFSATALHGETTVIKDIGNIKYDITQLRRNEKDFDSRKDLIYVDKFKQNEKKLQTDINHLNGALRDIGLSLDEPKQLADIIHDYNSIFMQIVESQITIGLDKKSGLYGKLIDTIHNAKALISDDHLLINNSLLQLRRSEKDFLLRLDEQYVEEFTNNYASFIKLIKQSQLTTSTQQQILMISENYNKAFSKLVKHQRKIGLQYFLGKQKKMRDTVHQVDDVLTLLADKVDNQVATHTKFIDNLIYSIFSIALILGVAMNIFTSRVINNAIDKIQTIVALIAQNKDLSLHIESNGKDEISTMGHSINQMISSFKELISQVNVSLNTVNQTTETLSSNIELSNQG
ncbi:MAG: methyl-accepting chemotaxis protein, partial [Alteromonadales bacterium]|nr:methyl-accepting chemotaxis protein [Alteromonadales bacterium]